LSLAAEVIRAGSAETVDRIDSFDVLQVKLKSFTLAYLLAKSLTATYAVNYFVWAVSPLGRTSNLLAAQIGLTIVGVFFIAVPRHYIELKWYELWRSSGKPFEYTETRPIRQSRRIVSRCRLYCGDHEFLGVRVNHRKMAELNWLAKCQPRKTAVEWQTANRQFRGRVYRVQVKDHCLTLHFTVILSVARALPDSIRLHWPH
jgi:hypothetical protein